jgi:hypothetical protein
MGLDVKEVKVDQNLQEVSHASADMSVAGVDEVQRKALANTVTAREESGRAEAAEKDSKASSNPAAGVYGDLLMSATGLPGAKGVSDMVQFVDTRASDVSSIGASKSGISSPSAKSIDDTSGIMRKPGLYREPASQHEFGATKAVEDTTPGVKSASVIATAAIGKASASSKAGVSASKSEDVMSRASIASSSLGGQPKDAASTWDVPPMQKSASITKAKELTFTHEIASKQALDSVKVVREQHAAMTGAAQRMAPGMNLDLSSGPRIRPAELLSEAKSNSQDDGRWRGA